ncbi:MAG: aspartyl protease family protein [Sphingomonas sp.]
MCALSLAILLAAAAPLAAEDVPNVAQTPPVLTEADVIAIGTDVPGRLTVPVRIGESGPYPFTIDTGAERTVISRELATLLNLARGPDVRVVQMAGRSDTNTAIIPRIRVNTLGGEQIEAPIFRGADLGAPGLLGLDSLKNRAVTIDFDKNEMTVRAKSRRLSSYPKEPGEIVISARSLLGQLVVTDASYRGRRVRVVLDTGTSVSIGNNKLRQLVNERGREVRPISVVSVAGSEVTADYLQIGRFSISSLTFENLPVAFADALPFERLGLNDGPALLLGMDALRQFRRVDIDFANREVRLSLPRAAG